MVFRAGFWPWKALKRTFSLVVGGVFLPLHREQLFRMLRADDKEGWQRLMEGKQGVPGLLEAYYKGRVKVRSGLRDVIF